MNHFSNKPSDGETDYAFTHLNPCAKVGGNSILGYHKS